MGVGAREVLQALAEQTRARTVTLIRSCPVARLRVADLTETFGLAQPTISHHMRELAHQGLVERTADGRNAWYSVPADRTDEVDGALGLVRDPPLTPEVIERIVRDLGVRAAGRFNQQTVAALVEESRTLLAARTGSGAVSPAQLALFAGERLDALARPDVGERSGPLEVLFVCVQNAGRSQMAAGYLRALAGDRVEVLSAGSEPKDQINPVAVEAMAEEGIDITGNVPKILTVEAVKESDVVITMGCGDTCPIFPGKRYEDWELDDPAGQGIEAVRPIRDDIRGRIERLLAGLLPEVSGVTPTR